MNTPRVAIVTGGARSIGAAIARAFANAEYRVVVADIDDANGLALAAEHPAQIDFVHTDLLDDDSVARCVAQAHSKFGPIAAVIHAACSYLDKGVNSTRSDWNSSLGVNVVGAAMLVRGAVPHMTGGGSIVLVGSISAKVAQAGRWLYPAGKAALLQLTRSMALDLAKHGIRVNSLSPGKAWSVPLQAKHADDRSKADAVEGQFHMLGRLADAEEVARAAVFLCSDDASFITGADLPVDGGFSALGPEGKPAQMVAAQATITSDRK